MKKSELVSELASRTGFTKADTAHALDTLTELITDALVKGQKVQLTGLGTFTVRNRKERNGVNPSSGEKIRIKAKRVAAFKASSSLATKVA